MPHLSGSASSSLTNAFRPPAEATIPTIGRMSPLSSFGGATWIGLWTLAATGARLAAGLPPGFAAPLDLLDLRGMCATPKRWEFNAMLRCVAPGNKRESTAIAVYSLGYGERA